MAKQHQLTKSTVAKTTYGMRTAVWGPAAWDSLFYSVLGGFPATYDNKNAHHRRVRKAFQESITNLRYTLPCGVCRDGFVDIYNERPLSDEDFKSSLSLAYWLYRVKDAVNMKLTNQELSRGMVVRTQQSPPFSEVIEMYLGRGESTTIQPGSCTVNN